MKKVWCRHIKWWESDRRPSWIYWLANGSGVDVPRSWKVCPICQRERPTRANIRAAELRFIMDNDQ